MARNSAPAHWLQRVAHLALQWGEPARRVCGDLRTAVAATALVVGCYCLSVGCVYLNQSGYRQFDYVVVTSWSIACIIAIMNAALYYACKQKNDKLLKYILCAVLAIYLLDLPLSVFTYVGSIVTTPQNILPLWLTLRFALCVPHTFLMYCLLVELREAEESSSGAALSANGDCDVPPQKELPGSNDPALLQPL